MSTEARPSFEETLKEIVREVFREEMQALALALDDRLLTVEQVAELLAFGKVDSVHRLKREGKLEAVYLGPGTLRFRNSDVQRLIKQGASDVRDCAA